MRAAGVFVALLVGHLLMLYGHTVPLSPWAPIAYFWHDVLIALLFAGFEYLVRRERVLWVAYALLVAYVALNVPIARALSSPLTWTMMRAAGGPLRDSITHYLTLANITAMIVVIGSGLLGSWLFQSVRSTSARPMLLSGLVFIGVGPLAAVKVDTSGLHRNAFTALWPLRLAPAPGGDNDWRTSPFGSEVPLPSLLQYRGAAAGRNVIVVILESTGARYLRTYGAAADPMPNLSRLASDAIVFERAYAVYPESVKGLFTLLCSRYLGFQVSAESSGEVPCPSIAQSLGNVGYRSALFHSGRFMYLGMEAVIRNRGFQTLEDAGAIGGNVNSSFGIDEPAAVQRILSWIDSGPATQPFFIVYMPVAGHHPYATPEAGPFANHTDLGRYQNALHYGDKSLGDLIEGLNQRKLDEETLLVILGDHGEAFGQHEGNFGHSMFIYDENVRIPYLIAAPGLIHGQIRSTRTASVIDTSPTILDLLGVKVPEESQGTSLLDPTERMALFFTDYSLGFLGLYDTCWKYIFEVDSRRSKLFNACRDPGESTDQSAGETGRVDFYRKRLETWIHAQDPKHAW